MAASSRWSFSCLLRDARDVLLSPTSRANEKSRWRMELYVNPKWTVWGPALERCNAAAGHLEDQTRRVVFPLTRRGQPAAPHSS
jgi:hypothetical protein